MRALIVILFSISLVSCASVGTKLKHENISQIKEGVTTQGEVIASLGQPYMQTLTSDGKVVMMYQYTKVENKATNFVPVANLFAGGMDIQQQILQILIDEHGVVERYLFTDSKSEVKSGLLNTQ